MPSDGPCQGDRNLYGFVSITIGSILGILGSFLLQYLFAVDDMRSIQAVMASAVSGLPLLVSTRSLMLSRSHRPVDLLFNVAAAPDRAAMILARRSSSGQSRTRK